MDRNKQETEMAVCKVADAIETTITGQPLDMHDIRWFERTGPNTFRATMLNKREIVITVRGL